MKKLVLFIILIACVLTGAMGVYGEGEAADPVVYEVPDVRIIMDGKLTSYETVPINIGGRTLLPLRELLVNLGVPNDDDHIQYNDTKKSVTILKGDTKITLRQGSRFAYVNGAAIRLDVTPVIYAKNNCFYIPLRFVSSALGKTVVWDGESNSILLKDTVEYDKIKAILDKSDEAMDKAGRYKIAANMDVGITAPQMSTNMGFDMSAEVDNVQKAMHMLMNISLYGTNMKTESYYYDEVIYTLSPMTSKWGKMTFATEEYDKVFSDQSDINLLMGTDETLCAGLSLGESQRADEILLKGDVYLNTLLNAASSAQELIDDMDMEMSEFNLEIIIDKNTNLMKSLVISVTGNITENDEKATMDIALKVNFTEYNGTFQIVVPQDVIKNAVEAPSPTIQ